MEETKAVTPLTLMALTSQLVPQLHGFDFDGRLGFVPQMYGSDFDRGDVFVSDVQGVCFDCSYGSVVPFHGLGFDSRRAFVPQLHGFISKISESVLRRFYVGTPSRHPGQCHRFRLPCSCMRSTCTAFRDAYRLYPSNTCLL